MATSAATRAAALKTRRKPIPAEPLQKPETSRFVVVSPKGRVFLICAGCKHWVKRYLVIKCPCCMAHRDDPKAAELVAESETE